MNEKLRKELIALAERDQNLLQSLKDGGELMDDAYHPQLRQRHTENTGRVREILRTNGWPRISEVGEDGSDAMWLIVQHSVLDPEFMSACIPILETLVGQGEARGGQLAFLRDRVLMQQEKPQIYGTQHVLDDNGELQPYPIEQPETVDERRLALGWEPLAERTRLLRADHEKVKHARSARGAHSRKSPPST